MDRRKFISAVGSMGALAPVRFAGHKERRLSLESSDSSGGFPSKNSSAITYLFDLERCQPTTALSDTEKRHCWRKLDYKTDTFQGVMLMGGRETEAPEVSYPLRVKGWHHVYVGMFNTAWRPYLEQYLWIKLKDDSAFSVVYMPSPSTTPWGVPSTDNNAGHWIEEVFWKTADLTHQTISFQQPCRFIVPPGAEYGNVCKGVWVAYFKLVELKPEEVFHLQVDRKRKDTKRLFAYNDAWSFHYDRGETVPGESCAASVKAQLEPYRDSDFSRIYWDGALGDQCNYFTKIGRMWIRNDIKVESFVRIGDRLVVESWEEYIQKGIDPFQVAVDYAHEIGLEFHACYRPGWAAFYWPPPFDGYNREGFYEKHSQLRCVRRDGTLAPGLSYAFPETRRFVLSLFREMASYPVDGVCLLFNRQPPFLEYEKPLVEGFKSKFGRDPREIDAKDPQWLSYRSSVLTEFMRDLKRDLDVVARQRRRPRRIEISAWVLGSEEENLFYGLDLATWLKEGLVDTLVPYTSAEHLFSWKLAWENPHDVEYWQNIVRGTNCRLALNVMPRDLSSQEYKKKAHALYESGVEYLAFWDTAVIGGQASNTLRRLGHAAEIAAEVRSGLIPDRTPKTRVRNISGWDMDFVPE